MGSSHKLAPDSVHSMNFIDMATTVGRPPLPGRPLRSRSLVVRLVAVHWKMARQWCDQIASATQLLPTRM